MQQGDFHFPRARRTDPDGSHVAADRAERSGRIAIQAAAVLYAVRHHPGLTSRELAAVIGRPGVDRYAVAGRAPELEARRLIRRTREPGEDKFLNNNPNLSIVTTDPRTNAIRVIISQQISVHSSNDLLVAIAALPKRS